MHQCLNCDAKVTLSADRVCPECGSRRFVKAQTNLASLMPSVVLVICRSGHRMAIVGVVVDSLP